jgi:hypothetical protein
MWDDERLLIDCFLTDDRDGIDWSFADAIGTCPAPRFRRAATPLREFSKLAERRSNPDS